MSFIAKTDYFGLAGTGVGLKVKDDDKNDGHFVNEEPDDKGDICDVTVYGGQAQPRVAYELDADLDLDLALGTLTSIEAIGKCMLAEVVIRTAGGSPVTVEASGELLRAAATETKKIDAGNIALSSLYMAQTLAASITLPETAVARLTKNDITITCERSVTRVEGVDITHDVWNGRIVQAFELVQLGSADPTITAATGWHISKKLTRSNKDSKRPTWSGEITKVLTSVAVVAG